MKEDSVIVVVDGVQVFSADGTFQQMQAQGRRIDRSGRCAAIAVIIAAASLVLNLVLLLC